MRRRRRPTLHHAVKDKRVTVLGPVKQPEMDFMSHRGGFRLGTTPRGNTLSGENFVTPPILVQGHQTPEGKIS